MSTYKIIRNDEWKTIQAEKAALAKDLEASQTFIESLKTGNLQATYSGDQETLIGKSMMSLRDRMIDLAREEERRNWMNQGIAQFSDILRVSDQHSSAALYDSIVSNLVRYLKANQGCIFSLNDDNDNDTFLELISCYAYDRKKFQEKRVPIGEGLIGQCFYEKQVIYLKDVPKEYVSISSGLGEARPRNVILVPMILDQNIHGIIELASFSLFEKYQIDFLQKVAESIAATLSSSRVSNRTQRLLQESLSQSEQLKSQEEEMRQSMEELTATQEEMERKSRELNQTAAEMNSILNGINATMATIEFTTAGVIVTANKNFLDTMKYSLAQIQGKHHRMFVPEDIRNSDDYKTFWTALASGKSNVNVFKRIDSSGQEVWLNAIYNPILDQDGKVQRVIKLANNVTASKQQEEEIRNLLEESRAQEEELRQNMEEVTATQDEIQRQNNLINESTAEMRSIMTGINATMASIEFSIDGTILHANENFLNAMGYSLAEIVGHHHRMFMPPGEADTTAYRQFWKELASGNPRVDTFERITKKKESILLNAIYNPILNASSEVVKVVKLATHTKADSNR
jgi:methyl-accepting chemotaxis protein